MQLAHQSNKPEILAYVKSLVSEAHNTPWFDRTEVQKVLLTEWRRPYSPGQLDLNYFNAVGSTSAVCPDHVYVDASGVGVGFFFKNKWQAWELASGWKEAGREIQWAEAVAVELGVRLMAKAGYTGRQLVFRSDNAQVVDAVKQIRPFAESHASRIVDKIRRLCQQYHIDLMIDWIPGEHNPADAPSRLRCVGGETTRFPHDINIPNHLRHLVYPYDQQQHIC
jgi:hypothetical protein